MNMKTLDSVKEILCRKLEKEETELREKGVTNLETLKGIQLITDTIKNIDKICMLEDGCAGDVYSRGGRWEAQMHGMYDRDSSYANRGSRNMRNYSNGGSYGRDSYGGGFSHGDAKSEILEHLEHMMNMAGSEKEREAIRRCMNDMRNA